MKKDTKKTMFVLFVIIIMFFSSAAWIILSAIPIRADQQSGQPQIPQNFVVDGRIDENVSSALIGRGFSIMEWHYYEGCCPDLILFVDALPSQLENQIFIQKLADSNNTWASVKSLRGERNWSVTNATELLPPLCDILYKPPVECGLMKFGNQSA